jgi:hypothetical protein
MKIFLLDIQCNTYGTFIVHDRNFSGLNFRLKGQRLPDEWKSPNVEFYDDNEPPSGDVILVLDLAGAIAIKKRCYEILADILSPNHQVFPLNNPADDYLLINVLYVEDILDEGQSLQVECIKNPRFRRYVFRPTECISGFFRIPQTCGCEILCCDDGKTQSVKRVIEENGITGVSFRELWDSETGPVDQFESYRKFNES